MVLIVPSLTSTSLMHCPDPQYLCRPQTMLSPMSFSPRDLGCLNCHSDKINQHSRDQYFIQQVVATSICSFSIALALVTLICLWRIRRSFRHQYVGASCEAVSAMATSP